jgi:hypothetical protein
MTHSIELYPHSHGVPSMLIIQVDAHDLDKLKELKEEIETLIKNKENGRD